MTQSSVRYLPIDASRVDQRLDNFLLSQLKGVPRSLVYRIIRSGEVRVNKRRKKPSYRLQERDVVRIPPVRCAESLPIKTSADDLEYLKSLILYDDNQLIVFNKPSGMAVHGGSGLAAGLIERVRANFAHAKEFELVHRLDRGTSGCLMIAKKRSALKALHEQLREGRVDKFYAAWVHGHWRQEVTAQEPLRKQQLDTGQRRVVVDPQGQSAKTVFSPVQRIKQATLMQIRLYTGRTHQIRVHAAHHRMPVIGDERYGRRDINQVFAKQGIRRMCLHAKAIRFELPENGGKISVSAPLPAEWQLLQR